MDDTDFERLMIDVSYIKTHPEAAGARGGNPAMGRTKGGSTSRSIWPWMRMVCRCDSLSLLVPQLIEGFHAEYLLADRGYDTDAIILKAVNEGMIPVIPSRKNRKHLREYDEYLYKLRFFRCCCPNPLYCYLAPYLLTTRSKKK